MITWKDALVRDLENVLKGKQENNEDAAMCDVAITTIKAKSDTDRDEIMQILSQYNLGYFAHLVSTLNYDRMADTENEHAKEV